MSSVLGLYGHVQRNIKISRLLVASFFVAACVCWILVVVSYNLTFRLYLGKSVHSELFTGQASIRHVAPTNETRSERRERFERKRQRAQDGQSSQARPTAFDLVAKGFTSALQTLYFPLLFVAGWFVYFWQSNGRLVRMATGAVPASRSLEKRLYSAVEVLSIQTGQPMPDIEIIELPALNAYATGLDPAQSTIAVTRGLLDRLNDRELRAVLAHEYTHILNRDSRVMVIATVFVGVFEGLFYYFLSGITGAHDRTLDDAPMKKAMRTLLAMPAIILFVALCASFAVCWGPVMLARALLSRSREFLADAGAVELTKDADALVSALQTIARCDKVIDVPPSFQALMIFGTIEGLLASHPPIEERITALRAYAGALPKGAPTMPRPILAHAQVRSEFGRRAAAKAR